MNQCIEPSASWKRPEALSPEKSPEFLRMRTVKDVIKLIANSLSAAKVALMDVALEAGIIRSDPGHRQHL